MLILNTLALGAACAGSVSSMVLPTLPRLEQYHFLEKPSFPQLTPLFRPPPPPPSPKRPSPPTKHPFTHHTPLSDRCLFTPSTHAHSSHSTVPSTLIPSQTWAPLSKQLLKTVKVMLTTPTHRQRNLMETIHLGFVLEDRALENVFLGVTYTRHSERRPMAAKDEGEELEVEVEEREMLECLGEATWALRAPGGGMMEGGWEVPDRRGRVSFLIWRID